MDSKGMNDTTQLRRQLAKLRHHGLKGLDSVRAEIFTACETINCGSYICNLSTGQIEEQYGLAKFLVESIFSNSKKKLSQMEQPLKK